MTPVSANLGRYLDVYRSSESYRRHYIIAPLRVYGVNSAAALAEAAERRLNACKSLGAKFVKRGDGWDVADSPPNLEVRLIPHVKGTCLSEALSESAQRIDANPMDVFGSPLAAAEVLEGPSDVHGLCLKTNHLVADAWSVRHLITLIAQDLESGFAQTDRPSDLVTHAEQEAQLVGEVGGGRLDWWRDYLVPGASIQPVRSPEGSIATVGFSLPWHCYEDLDRALAGSRSASVASLALVCFADALMNWRDASSISINVANPNRRRANRSLIADVVDWQPIRASAATGPDSPFERAQTIGRAMAIAAKNYLPYWSIVRKLNPELYNHRSGFSNFFFNFLKVQATSVVEGNLKFDMDVDIQPRPRLAFFDLILRVIPKEGSSLYIEGMYNKSAIADRTAQNIVSDIRQRLLELSYIAGGQTTAVPEWQH